MSNDKNLKVIKASAGSGKTYNLALEYIRHLLFVVDKDNGKVVPRRDAKSPNGKAVNAHRQILAITFTKKATGEMKDRIIKELYLLSCGDKSDYLQVYVDYSRLTQEEVRTLAKYALQDLLFDYSNFNVSTIDSFFQGILRNFARELDRDFTYELELDEPYALSVAAHNFMLSLGRYGNDGPMEKWVKGYLRNMVHGDPEKVKWKFFDDAGDLYDFARPMTSETFRNSMPAIRQYFSKTDTNGNTVVNFDDITKFQQHLVATSTQLEKDIECGLTDLAAEIKPGYDSGVLNGSRTFNSWYKKVTAAQKWLPLKTDALRDASEDTIRAQYKKNNAPSPTIVTRMTRLVNEHYKYYDLLSFFKHILSNVGLLGMLTAIDKCLEDYRHDTNCILISDTNDLINTVIKSGPEFIYERVGTTISHYMIDEFQDTSAMQYENFKSLIKESLDCGNFNMLIGDAKQSIYRFRNADPKVFREQVDKHFGPYIASTGGDKSTNYRSSRNIVEFNNALFAHLRDNYKGSYGIVETTFKDVEQNLPDKVDEKKVPGYVRLNMGNYGGLVNSQAEPDQKDVDVLAVLPEYLLQLHERFDWGKMGILVNSGKTDGKKIVECILKHNMTAPPEKQIKIISGESLLLSNSSIVNRIIAMLRFIDISQFSADEEDSDAPSTEDPNIAIVPRWKRRRKSDQRLYTALSAFIKAVDEQPTADAGQLLAQCFKDIDAAKSASGNDPFEASVKGMLPGEGELTTLVSIVENIIKHIKRQDNAEDREVAFLMAFQDTVRRFCSKHNGGTVREFLKYWDTMKKNLSVPSSSNDDSINIMTIHKSKGLEFDCVIIPFADWELSSNSHEKEYWMPRKAVLGVLNAYNCSCDENIVPPLLNVGKGDVTHMFDAGLITTNDAAGEFIHGQQSEVVIDNLNKTYVAFTRPCTELHIFSPAKSCSKKGTPVYAKVQDLLSAFVTDTNVMTPISAANGSPSGWYERGVMSTREDIDSKRDKPKEGPAQQVIKSYQVTDMPERITVKVENVSSSSIATGKRLHAMLSRIRDRRDVERVINAAKKHGTITDKADDACNINFVNEHVKKPIVDENGLIAKWFDPENTVYSERTITKFNSQKDDGIDNRRPDRIIRRPDGTWIIIDFKSGELTVEDQPGHVIDCTIGHCKQVNGYIDRLCATGLVPDSAAIKGRIWYIKHDKVIDTATGKQLP